MDRQREEQEVHPQEIPQGLILLVSALWDTTYVRIELPKWQEGVFALGYSDFGDRTDGK